MKVLCGSLCKIRVRRFHLGKQERVGASREVRVEKMSTWKSKQGPNKQSRRNNEPCGSERALAAKEPRSTICGTGWTRARCRIFSYNIVPNRARASL